MVELGEDQEGKVGGSGRQQARWMWAKQCVYIFSSERGAWTLTLVKDAWIQNECSVVATA